MALFSREYLSSNSLTPFPFAGSTVPERVFRLFCDAVVFVPFGESLDAVVSSVSVEDGSVLRFDFTVGGETEHVSVVQGASSDHYSVVRGPKHSSVVVDLDNLSDSDPFSDDGTYRISESCANYEPGNLLSFSLWNSPNGKDEPVCTASGISGDVRIHGGTNTKVVSSDEGITISAIPGAGEGTVKCQCEESDPIDENLKLIPDDYGFLVIEGDGCVSVSTPIDGSGKPVGTIQINGRCTAPCPVSKYVEELDQLSEKNEDLNAIYDSLMGTGERYNALVRKYNRSLKSGSQREFIISMTGNRPYQPAATHVPNRNGHILGMFNIYNLAFVLENRSRVTASVVITISNRDLDCHLAHFILSPPAEAQQSGSDIQITRVTRVDKDPPIGAYTSSITLPSGSSLSGTAIYTARDRSADLSPDSASFFVSARVKVPDDEEESGFKTFNVTASTSIR